MSIVNKRNAFFGWVALKVARRFVRRKVRPAKKRFGR